MSSQPTVKIICTFYMSGPAEADLREFLSNHGGKLLVFQAAPYAPELTELGLDNATIGVLQRAGIQTLNQLTALNEPELLALRGVKWLRYRQIVQTLHAGGQSLKGAPQPEDRLELIDIPGELYAYLRTPSGQSGTFNRVSDLTSIDLIDAQKRIRRWRELRAKLIDRNLDFASPYPCRVLGELPEQHPSDRPALIAALGLAPDSPLAELTARKIHQIGRTAALTRYLRYLTELGLVDLSTV